MPKIVIFHIPNKTGKNCSITIDYFKDGWPTKSHDFVFCNAKIIQLTDA